MINLQSDEPRLTLIFKWRDTISNSPQLLKTLFKHPDLYDMSGHHTGELSYNIENRHDIGRAAISAMSCLVRCVGLHLKQEVELTVRGKSTLPFMRVLAKHDERGWPVSMFGYEAKGEEMVPLMWRLFPKGGCGTDTDPRITLDHSVLSPTHIFIECDGKDISRDSSSIDLLVRGLLIKLEMPPKEIKDKNVRVESSAIRNELTLDARNLQSEWERQQFARPAHDRKLLYGGIETGGTHWVCGVGDGYGELIKREEFKTTTPDETIRRAIDFFNGCEVKPRELTALGVGSFGPIDLRPDSNQYGYVTTTPKKYWKFTDIVKPFEQAFGLPVAFDTDTNAAALGEYYWGAAKGLDVFCYITVGTGIGAGILINGKPLHGKLHTEFGHIMIPHEDTYEGICPMHRDYPCLEGLASGVAVNNRWQVPGEEIHADHEAWKIEARYLAYGVVNIICLLSPERIIMGGGVMKKEGLLEKVRDDVEGMLNGYLKGINIDNNYIVRPQLKDDAGVKGAIALALEKAS
jgi:fructokinase